MSFVTVPAIASRFGSKGVWAGSFIWLRYQVWVPPWSFFPPAPEPQPVINRLRAIPKQDGPIFKDRIMDLDSANAEIAPRNCTLGVSPPITSTSPALSALAQNSRW